MESSKKKQTKQPMLIRQWDHVIAVLGCSKNLQQRYWQKQVLFIRAEA